MSNWKKVKHGKQKRKRIGAVQRKISRARIERAIRERLATGANAFKCVKELTRNATFKEGAIAWLDIAPPRFFIAFDAIWRRISEAHSHTTEITAPTNTSASDSGERSPARPESVADAQKPLDTTAWKAAVETTPAHAWADES